VAGDDPRLRLVPNTPLEDDLVEDAPRGPSRSTLLAGALAITVTLLILSWIFTGRYVASLEAEVDALRSQAEQRQSVIDAQNERLADIRRRVEGLSEALNAPAPRV